MNEQASRFDAQPISGLKRRIRGDRQFGINIARGVTSWENISSSLRLSGTARTMDVGRSLIQGIAGIGVSNPEIVLANGFITFPLLELSGLDREGVGYLKDAYVDGISFQRKASNPRAATALVVIGKHLAPHLLRTAPPSTAREIQDAWDLAMARKDASWKNVADQANAMTNNLAFQFINKTYREQYMGTEARPDPNPAMIQRRQAVYEHRGIQSLQEVAKLLGVGKTIVHQDRHWLIQNGLLAGTVASEVEQIINKGLTNPHSELEYVLLCYLMGVSTSKISTRMGHAVDAKVQSIEKSGLIPSKQTTVHIHALREQGLGVGTISHETGIPLSTIKLILSVPFNKRVFDELPLEATVFEP